MPTITFELMIGDLTDVGDLRRRTKQAIREKPFLRDDQDPSEPYSPEDLSLAISELNSQDKSEQTEGIRFFRMRLSLIDLGILQQIISIGSQDDFDMMDAVMDIIITFCSCSTSNFDIIPKSDLVPFLVSASTSNLNEDIESIALMALAQVEGRFPNLILPQQMQMVVNHCLTSAESISSSLPNQPEGDDNTSYVGSLYSLESILRFVSSIFYNNSSVQPELYEAATQCFLFILNADSQEKMIKLFFMDNFYWLIRTAPSELVSQFLVGKLSSMIKDLLNEKETSHESTMFVVEILANLGPESASFLIANGCVEAAFNASKITGSASILMIKTLLHLLNQIGFQAFQIISSQGILDFISRMVHNGAFQMRTQASLVVATSICLCPLDDLPPVLVILSPMLADMVAVIEGCETEAVEKLVRCFRIVIEYAMRLNSAEKDALLERLNFSELSEVVDSVFASSRSENAVCDCQAIQEIMENMEK